MAERPDLFDLNDSKTISKTSGNVIIGMSKMATNAYLPT
jgi:hypothetical protein